MLKCWRFVRHDVLMASCGGWTGSAVRGDSALKQREGRTGQKYVCDTVLVTCHGRGAVARVLHQSRGNEEVIRTEISL